MRSRKNSVLSVLSFDGIKPFRRFGGMFDELRASLSLLVDFGKRLIFDI